MTTVSIIAAIGENRELGKDNRLLFHIAEDLKRFKRLTLNHPVIIGRKTYQSLGKILKQRINIIVTRDKNFKAKAAFVFHQLNKAIEFACRKDKKEIFIIGGGQIYKQTIGQADKLYLTIVKGSFAADTFFPDYGDFQKIIFQQEGQDKKYQYTFLELERAK